jgi:hypothetical protein
MLRIPHCLDSRFTDGGNVVSPTHRPCTTPQKHYFSASGTHFYWRLSDPQGLVRPEGLDKWKKENHLIGFGTLDHPVCSALTTMLPRRIAIKWTTDRNRTIARHSTSRALVWTTSHTACRFAWQRNHWAVTLRSGWLGIVLFVWNGDLEWLW